VIVQQIYHICSCNSRTFPLGLMSCSVMIIHLPRTDHFTVCAYCRDERFVCYSTLGVFAQTNVRSWQILSPRCSSDSWESKKKGKLCFVHVADHNLNVPGIVVINYIMNTLFFMFLINCTFYLFLYHWKNFPSFDIKLHWLDFPIFDVFTVIW